MAPNVKLAFYLYNRYTIYLCFAHSIMNMLSYLKYLNVIFSLSLTVIYPVFARLYLLNCLSTVYI